MLKTTEHCSSCLWQALSRQRRRANVHSDAQMSYTYRLQLQWHSDNTIKLQAHALTDAGADLQEGTAVLLSACSMQVRNTYTS